jgi:hypothetical protein
MVSTHYFGPTDGFKEEALLKLFRCSMLLSDKGGKSGLCRKPYLGMCGHLRWKSSCSLWWMILTNGD